MENRIDMSTKQHTANSPISYYQIYEYAVKQNKTIEDIIEGASQENTRKNLEIITSYAHIYCAADNNPVKQIVSETYEWASDYSSKGLHFITDGFSQSGGQQSLLASVLGVTLFGAGGVIVGGVAGSVHAMYSLSNNRALNDDQKKLVFDLKKIAERRMRFFNRLNTSSGQDMEEVPRSNKRVGIFTESKLLPIQKETQPIIENEPFQNTATRIEVACK